MSDTDYSKFVAITEIRHGEEDGSLTVYKPGESVADADQELLDQWYASGSIGPGVENVDAVQDENERLKLLVADLTAQLEAAKAPANASAPAGSGAEVLVTNDKKAEEGTVQESVKAPAANAPDKK